MTLMIGCTECGVLCSFFQEVHLLSPDLSWLQASEVVKHVAGEISSLVDRFHIAID